MVSMPAPVLARLRAVLADRNLVRIALSFWLFGLINNIFYVILLSAALDLVGPAIPKATVLLASIIPALATQLVVPYIIHLVPYPLRVTIFVALSTGGMLAVALSPADATASSIAAKVAGIVLANVSSGAGEVNFLGLTHFYGPASLAAWGSGTGGAGLVGAGAYALATTTLGIGVRSTLVASAVLPAVMAVAFFLLLPMEPLRASKRFATQQPSPRHNSGLGPGVERDDDANTAEEFRETSALLDDPDDMPMPAHVSVHSGVRASLLMRLWTDLRSKLSRARTLVIPYMIPLFLVYLAEYTINQGVAPTLLFPPQDSPFSHFRAFYPAYGALYQAGVFISRSSLPLLRIRTLYTPSVLQLLNLALLITQALRPFLPNVYFVFALVFWEGLLGGLVYVSAFAAVREEVPPHAREFSLGAVTVSDSGGIFVAGLVGAVLEPALCSWQARHGRDWCRQL